MSKNDDNLRQIGRKACKGNYDAVAYELWQICRKMKIWNATYGKNVEY